MQYRKIPKTGDKLSVLGFGCMRLPEKRGKIDEKRAETQLFSAIEQGVNYIDTAIPYHMGASEPFLGKVLQGEYRKKVKLATKLPPWYVHDPTDMDKLFNSQLENLRTDYIDYYLLHALDGDSFKKMEEMGVLDFLERLKSQGRIRNAGFSFHGRKKDFKKIVDAYDWEFCQIQYNYLDTQNQAGTKGLEYAAKKELGIIIMEPLRGGNLGKKSPKQVQALWDAADVKRVPVQWSLEWIWNHPQVTVILSGMNEEAHIEQNIQMAGNALPNRMSKKDLELVDGAQKVYRKLMKAGCTGCRYCMPCPAGVNIPACFEFYNNLHVFDDKANARLFYLAQCGGLFSGKPALASLCEECGECEKACPQNLPIMDLLKDVSQEFEGVKFRMILKVAGILFGLKRWNILRKQK